MLPKVLTELADKLSGLPGIGPRSAMRLAFYLADQDKSEIGKYITAIKSVSNKLTRCGNCHNYSEDSMICGICADTERQDSIIMVVETPLDVLAFAQSDYRGMFHVLGGLISPLLGKGPDQLTIELFRRRLATYKTSSDIEIVVALPTSLEGEATVEYLSQFLAKHTQDLGTEYRFSRLATGLPNNSSVEYQDPKTLNFSFENRKIL